MNSLEGRETKTKNYFILQLNYRMKHEMKGSIADNAAIIRALIEEEDRNWIPSKGVEWFNFLGSQLRDLNGRFVAEDTNDYLYLNRDDWFNVTVQKCHNFKDLTYYFVYVEKDVDDKGIWIPQDLVPWTQCICHTFRWVRSLRHALKLWELWSELALWLAHPEDCFLTREERDNGKQN